MHIRQSFRSAVTLELCAGLLVLNNSLFTNNSISESVDCSSSGGAVSIILVNSTEEVFIEIESCIFMDNHATTGEAVYIEIRQPVSDALVKISNSFFSGNVATLCDDDNKELALLNGAGGALSLLVNTPSSRAPVNNTITISNSTFTCNTAVSGGGVHYYIWTVRSGVQQHLPVLSVAGSVFDSIKGNSGSAALISPVKVDEESGFLYYVYFQGNVFIDNAVQSNGIHTGIGTVLIRSINVRLAEMHEVLGNQGSAIVLLNAVLTFQEASMNYFIGNVGFNGGALQLYGGSVLVVGFNASLELVNNQAMGRGGAIYHFAQDTFQDLTRECSLRYTKETSMYCTPWIFVNLGTIFGTCPKRSLCSPEHLCVASFKPHISFELGICFKSFTKNQLNPCTIFHRFLLIWVRF